MSYIDGFALPILQNELQQYRQVAAKIAEIWIEHGALEYMEHKIDDAMLEGTRSFVDATNANKAETVIFGWVRFESREARDLANQRVAADPRMADLMAPLTTQAKPIFDAERMVYGGFKPLIHCSK